MNYSHLVLSIFNGSKSWDDKNAYETLCINHISRFQYDDLQTFLSFKTDQDRFDTVDKTRWNQSGDRLKLFDDFELITSLPLPMNRNEMVRCTKDNETIYFSEFILEAKNIYNLSSSIKAIFKMGGEQALELTHIDFIKFNLGVYELWFKNEADCNAAQQLTGWSDRRKSGKSLVLEWDGIRRFVIVNRRNDRRGKWIYPGFDLVAQI